MTTAAHDITATLMVGMEIHVELATRSKMWTAAPNIAHPDYYDAQPNTLLDPVVVGMPGVLPVMNRAAVELAIRVGLALNCSIARRTKWDRKSYYYPDLPKNYQISQYDLPLCYDGYLNIAVADHAGELPDADTHRVGIIRAHLEEDAGKLLHEAPGGRPIDHSIVDLNRAGTPLLEIVTQPDIQSAEQAVTFAQTLRDICRHIGVSEAIMQRGHMRFEPNINVIIERDGHIYKTPIVEIKNLNSFKALRGAIEHEYERQIDEWLATGRVMGAREKSTRGWDDVRGVTVLQREKEDPDEYRYFPDPDLVILEVDDAWLERIRSEMPVLPQQRRQRYLDDYGLGHKQAEQLLGEPALADYYDRVVEEGVEPKRAATLLLNVGLKHANERGVGIAELGVTPQQVCGIVDLADNDRISSSAADELFGLCADSDDSAEALAQKHGLLQVSDTGALEQYVDQVLADPKNAQAVQDVKAGKDKAVGALLGQVMKLSKGQANPKLAGDLIRQKLQE